MSPRRHRRPWLLLGFTLVVVLFLVLPARAVEPADGADPDSAVTVGGPATLVVWNRPIMTLRARIGALTPAVRVAHISSRIADLPLSALTGNVRAVASSVGAISGYWISVDDLIVFAVLPEDLDPDAGLTLDQAAAAAAQNLAAVLSARAEQGRLPLLVRAIVLSIVATAVFAVCVWGIVWLRRRLLLRRRGLVPKKALIVRGLDVRPFLRAFEEGAVKAFVVGIGLFACYLWLAFLLLQFPYTEPWGAGLGSWIVSLFRKLVLGAVAALPGLFTVVVIFLLTRLISQAVDRFFRSVEFGWLRVDWLEAETARATRRIVVVVIWLFALTVAYPYIPGSSSEAFKGISVLVGLMISLGATGFVNQVMSGLVIVYSRSVKMGEYVQVGETQGKITEIGALATRIMTPTRQEITIPNAMLVGSSITNYSRTADEQTGSIIGTTITIGYDTPWRQVEAMLRLAAERTAQVRAQPRPEVRQRSLGDFYVAYELLVSIDRPDTQQLVLSDLHAQIQDVFNEFGVQIMSPNFVAQPPEKVWVPPSQWHEAPAEPPPDLASDGGRV